MAGDESPVLDVFKTNSPLDDSPLPLAVSLKTLNIDPKNLDLSKFRDLSLLVVEIYQECRRIMDNVPAVCVGDPLGSNQVVIKFIPPPSILSGYEPSFSKDFEYIPSIIMLFLLDIPLYKTRRMTTFDPLEWHEYPNTVNINVEQYCAKRGLKSGFKLYSSPDQDLLHQSLESLRISQE